MPVSTDLSQSPYLDTFNPNKNYVRVLAQPSVSIQVREINEIQSIFQNQIEQFGDNIFATGSIISGCNFIYNNNYSYATINDIDYDGNSIDPSTLVGYTVIDDTINLRAVVTNFAAGFESTPGSPKTLYLHYQNSGVSGNETAFTAGHVIRAFDATVNGIESVDVISGGSSFSNTDNIIALSSIVVSLTSGALSNTNIGDYIINGLGANVQVISVDATTLANANQLIVTISPRQVDLTTAGITANAWSFTINQPVSNVSSGWTGLINNIIGTGFIGKIITSGIGSITDIDVLQKGVGYSTVPYLTIQSLTGSYSNLTMTALNYVSKPIVSAVGFGYGFTVTSGVVFQKGTFLQVGQQEIIVDKYDTFPDNVCVGFATSEQIIDYNIDNSLLDNSNDTTNFQAPGANRLQLTPILQITNTAIALSNSQFLTLVQFANGQPFLQNQQTVYSVIGDDIATRVNDVSGNFVIDPWLVTTVSVSNNQLEGEYVSVVVDPGLGYIDGYRIQTNSNYPINITKGIDTTTVNNIFISANYGNFVRVNNLGGVFAFSNNDYVNLYDASGSFISNLTSSETLTSHGNLIGNARMRSLVLEIGVQGTANAIYDLYLYDIVMAPGKSFANTQSIYYTNGSYPGIADIVTQFNATTNTYVAALYDTSQEGMVFDSGVESVAAVGPITYTFRTIDQAVTIANTGSLVKTLTGIQTYPYTGSLTSPQLQTFSVVPLTTDIVYYTRSTGNVSVASTTANIVGNTTSSTYLTDFATGDYVTVVSTANCLRRVVSVVNSSFLIVDSNVAFTNTNAYIYRTFPANVPIPFGSRAGLSGTISGGSQTLTLSFGNTFSFNGTQGAAITTDVQLTSVTEGTFAANRNQFILICCGNNASGTSGPWSLGVPGAFRLDGVYIGNSTVSNTGTNYMSNFFIDNGQNIDYEGLSYLNQYPASTITLNSGEYLLVQFDWVSGTQSSGKFYDATSYIGSNSALVFSNDSLPLANLGSAINSFEVPELFDSSGDEIDLLSYFDFRPTVQTTVTPSTTYSTAPLNPNTSVTFSATTDKQVPVPGSQISLNYLTYYLGRTDSVFVNQNGQITELSGQANSVFSNRLPPSQPTGTMKITDINIPAYPNLPISLSAQMNQILQTGIDFNNYSTSRNSTKTIDNRGTAVNPGPNANNVLPYNQPRNYTQADIGNLDRRLTNIEYETALSAMEANVSSMVIPSSVDPSTDRFKFGFFVDNFTTSSFSDLTNPQYEASKDPLSGDIEPPRMTWDVSVFGNAPPDWIDYPIITQPIATTNPSTPTCAINLSNVVAYQTIYRSQASMAFNSANVDILNLTFASNTTLSSTIQYTDTPLSTWLAQNPQGVSWANTQGQGIEGANLTTQAQAIADLTNAGLIGSASIVNVSKQGTSASGPDSLLNILQAENINPSAISTTLNAISQFSTPYTNLQPGQVTTMPSGGSYAGTIYNPPVSLFFYNYDQPTKIEIFQNNNLIATTDITASTVATPQNLSQTDISLLEGSAANFWFNDNPQFFMQPFINVGSGFVSYAGKLVFNYNPNNGINFTVKVTSNSPNWRYVIAYPIDGSSVGCIPPQISANVIGSFVGIFQNYGISYTQTSQMPPPSFPDPSILIGYTEVWNPTALPAPTTSVVAFDSTADWSASNG